MKACFVTSGSLNAFWQDKLEKTEQCDLLAFGFNGLGLVSYKRELEGKTEFFHDAAGLSKAIGGVVVSGCDTDTYGIFRHSALIADKGRILGVSDMSFSLDESEFRAGGNFRVYETGAGRIGLLVGDDVYFLEAAKVLSLCDADFIVCVYHQVLSNMTEIMLRAAAFSCGVPIALVASEFVSVAGIGGDILYSSRREVNETEIRLVKDFHKISTRRRGFFLEQGF